MIQYGKQNINQKDIQVVLKVLRSDFLTQGPWVLEFEKALAKYCGSKYAVLCSNGTSALHLSYLVVELKKGDEVITTPNTFVATTNMLLEVGLRPVFCDIRLDTYNIDEKQIEKLITKKTKAIVVVHFAGQAGEMKKIYSLAHKYHLKVIVDGAHALGGKYYNYKIGVNKYSDLTTFSFHPVKPITTAEGGAVLTNNQSYYQKLLSLRSHGVHKDKNGQNIMTELGYNYRMNEIQASLGLSQLKRLDSFIQKRHQVVGWYKKELKNISEIILPTELKNNYSAWHIYVIRTVKAQDRDSLVKHLKNKGIGVNFHYPAVYSQPYYQKLGYRDKLKNMEIYHNTCITLPCHTLLKREDVKYISNSIKKFFKK
jgi:perosamine synthetase